MLEPYEGRVFDPCCGSGGMFVQSEKFIKKYVGLADEEDDFNFVERFTALKIELEKQIAEEAELNRKIAENLSKIKLPQ